MAEAAAQEIGGPKAPVPPGLSLKVNLLENSWHQPVGFHRLKPLRGSKPEGLGIPALVAAWAKSSLILHRQVRCPQQGLTLGLALGHRVDLDDPLNKLLVDLDKVEVAQQGHHLIHRQLGYLAP